MEHVSREDGRNRNEVLLRTMRLLNDDNVMRGHQALKLLPFPSGVLEQSTDPHKEAMGIPRGDLQTEGEKPERAKQISSLTRGGQVAEAEAVHRKPQ